MSPALEVPSDIALLEKRYSKGERELSFFEKLGICTMLPMLHLRRTRNDKYDFKNILKNKFNDTPSDEVEEILISRQNSVSKKIKALNGIWIGTIAFTLLSLYSIRFYDYKSKLVIIPFIAYGGSWVGRWTGDMLSGRWSEYRRDRFLGELTAKTYYKMSPE